jgi:hypothetical protein
MEGLMIHPRLRRIGRCLIATVAGSLAIAFGPPLLWAAGLMVCLMAATVIAFTVIHS